MQQRIVLLSQMKGIDRGRRDPVFFAEHWLGINLNPFQKRVLGILADCLWGGKYKMEDLIEMVWRAGNRSGKTVLIAIIHIYFAYYKIGITFGAGYDDFKYRTFDISPQSRQAKECLKYIEDILLGRLTWTVDGKRYSNQGSLKLKDFYTEGNKNDNLGELRYNNRSVTYAFSTGSDQGAGFQGLPAGLVTYDECVLSHHLEDELDSNVYSRLGDYGKLMVLVSTPNEEGKSQQYFHHIITEAKAGENNYIPIEGSYLENIFISQEKRDSHYKTIMERDPVMGRQIIYGDFVATGGQMYEAAVIEQMWKGMGRAPEGFFQPEQKHEYLISVDWGVADKGDLTVMLVWDITSLPVKIVYAYHKRGGDPYELMAVLRNLKISYNNGAIIMDTSGLGGTIFKKLLKHLKPIAFEAGGSGEEKGNALFYSQILLTKNRKKRIVDGQLVEDNPDFGWIRAPYLSQLGNEMATYQLDDKKLKQDWVSAFYIGCWQIWKRYGDQGVRRGSFRYSPFRTRVPSTVIQ